MKTIGVIMIALAMLVAITGVVMADPGVAAVPEHQGITTVTVIDVDGLVMDSASMAMTLTNNPTSVTGGTTAVGVPLLGTVVGAPGFTLLQQQIAQIAALGGSLTWHAADGTNPAVPAGTVIIDSIFIPSTAMGVVPVGGPLGFPTLGATYAWWIANAGVVPSTVTQGIHTGMLSPGQTQYSTTYNSNLVAQHGHTTLIKTMNIDTSNKLAGQSNVDAKTQLSFIATADGGNAHGSESLMLDGSGSATSTASSMLCPFGPSIVGDVIPPFCNIIQAGSEFDLTVGSVTTAANTKFIGTDASNPVVLNYEINVKPYGTSDGMILAMGSASAYIKAHTQEGRTGSNTVSQDMSYKEETSVNGMISGFSKKIHYQSGPKLL